jgi:hypothetical protein
LRDEVVQFHTPLSYVTRLDIGRPCQEFLPTFLARLPHLF